MGDFMSRAAKIIEPEVAKNQKLSIWSTESSVVVGIPDYDMPGMVSETFLKIKPDDKGLNPEPRKDRIMFSFHDGKGKSEAGFSPLDDSALEKIKELAAMLRNCP